MDLVFAPSQIEHWLIDRLRPYARNARIHGTDQVAKIAASMAVLLDRAVRMMTARRLRRRLRRVTPMRQARGW